MTMKDLMREAAGLAGATLIAFGAWLAYAPAGYIVGGLLLMVATITLSRTSPTRWG